VPLVLTARAWRSIALTAPLGTPQAPLLKSAMAASQASTTMPSVQEPALTVQQESMKYRTHRSRATNVLRARVKWPAVSCRALIASLALTIPVPV